ncbi:MULTISPECIES: DUF6528 family protein [unclassified Streptomyces]|uniref:DUF6528 family protein n=1 Tax=unclassified Streptomyces TaxID=2593676 RepID=UPI00278C481E|nr:MULTISPECIES: DUF6528 family protein [unclassified Streptomyces]
MEGSAFAADYPIVTVEQSANQIQRFSNGSTDWNGTPDWYWSAPDGDASWIGLSDVKRRSTAKWGYVSLCTASGTASRGGRAAMIRESDKAVVWTAVVPGNPHSVERIENHGAIVTACSRARVFSSSYQSGGGINVFVPSTHGGTPPTAYGSSISVGFPDAHGVLWDKEHELLLATGLNELRAYRLVTNASDIITGLTKVASVTFGGTAHDIQPDYASANVFYTVGGSVNPDHGIWQATPAYDAATGTWSLASPTKIYDWSFTKSFGRLPDGTYFWVDAPSADVWWNDTVGFSGRADSVRTGARFYKARYWSHVFT